MTILCRSFLLISISFSPHLIWSIPSPNSSQLIRLIPIPSHPISSISSHLFQSKPNQTKPKIQTQHQPQSQSPARASTRNKTLPNPKLPFANALKTPLKSPPARLATFAQRPAPSAPVLPRSPTFSYKPSDHSAHVRARKAEI